MLKLLVVLLALTVVTACGLDREEEAKDDGPGDNAPACTCTGDGCADDCPACAQAGCDGCASEQCEGCPCCASRHSDGGADHEPGDGGCSGGACPAPLLGSVTAAVGLAVAGCVTTPPVVGPVGFALQDMNASGEVWDSAAAAGMPVAIEFYFNGCPACERNAANVKRLAQARHGETAKVVEVSIDCDGGDYADWIRRHGSSWPVLNGCDRELTRRLGVSAYPTTVVLDRDHSVLFTTVGVWSAATYRRIDAALAAP